MIRSTLPARHRLHELLADRALFGLAADEATELDSLLAHYPVWDPEVYDRTAAAVDLALGPESFEPLPAGLAAKVEQQAAACIRRLTISRL